MVWGMRVRVRGKRFKKEVGRVVGWEGKVMWYGNFGVIVIIE